MARVLCAGLIAVDFIFDLASFPEEGTKVRADGLCRAVGGGGIRSAAAVAGLGGAAALAGVVGEDDLGRFVRAELRRLGIDDALVTTVPGAETPTSAVLVSAGGERTVINHRDARLFSALPEIPDRLDADALLTDTRWPECAARLLDAAARGAIPAVIDAEAPLAPALGLLSRATHVAFSEQGLADFAEGSVEEALPRAAALSTWVAVTRGPRPVLCHDGVAMRAVPGFEATPVDTLGAGDIWHGAFALGLAGGATEPDAVRYANAAAALAISRSGPDRMPTAEEVAALLAADGGA
ncbi:PfkB family carbohydrate kinase [Tropicimonas sp. IMCC6043]|uniref:PfkB family carbohydrate kinase n=1 Tax=Tropicimonas sp. IMCC6043 TaxID=2510645 RepID=UPI00101CBC38|nr:PfkB family carbohydrate kinase [Tropicimonas sp. IMCC6043]RYH10173.1 sugar kinase [Tropicimonas sp. IMCC6043]